MYLALLGINGRFYAKVAEKSYQVQSKNQQAGAAVAQTLAQTIYMTIFYISCGGFAAVLRSLPTFGTILALLMNCFIFSYYCFEFRWVFMQWTLEQRLAYVEQHWAFFLGFGLPGTVATFFLSTLRSGAMFALLYPGYIVMAFMATPSASSSGTPGSSTVSSGSDIMLPNRVPVFAGVRQMCKVVIALVKKVGGVRVESIMADKKQDIKKNDKEE
ncbi:hypothetical protein DM01DRAFT_320276 [Hesseltinella vesiculosa]|uniref:EI24-domain-containing protein n=1 Tax=Hesseltinella vesiculosa TaxID=101127 RepID=A0A1X2GC44_9FUNG|nr:hypothetical protein DM01DRAFT_320276 [Hesseltinella vesiculosa]